jgi:hypothetical protein
MEALWLNCNSYGILKLIYFHYMPTAKYWPSDRCLQIVVLWVVPTCGLVDCFKHFGGAYCPLLRGEMSI